MEPACFTHKRTYFNSTLRNFLLGNICSSIFNAASDLRIQVYLFVATFIYHNSYTVTEGVVSINTHCIHYEYPHCTKSARGRKKNSVLIDRNKVLTLHRSACEVVYEETMDKPNLPVRPINPVRLGVLGRNSGGFFCSVGVQGEWGGVVKEAESVKCLVETQSPSLATDPCLLSEGQSWASQLSFSPPPSKKRVCGGMEGSSPIPSNLALCHSCKLGPDICSSLPPFFYTSLFHLFPIQVKPPSDDGVLSQHTIF